MYMGLQESGKCHFEREPRFQYSQTASPCLQPWRRQNLEKKSEYPHKEVTPLLFPQPMPSLSVLLSYVGFGAALWAPCERRVQLIVRWSRKATSPATVTQEQIWQEEPLKCLSWAKPLERAAGSPALYGGTSACGDNMTSELPLERCSFMFTCLLPPMPFHSLQLCSSSSEVPKRTAGWMVSLDTLKRHKKGTIKENSTLKQSV